MEVDIIVLPKDGSKQKLQMGMKQAVKNVFKKLYNNLQDENFEFDLNEECVLESELAKEHIQSLSKEEVTSIIDKCRSISLWDRFFGQYKKFQNFKEKIEELQPYRNTVMHHKRITQQEYEKVRKSLKAVNKLLVDAINVLEEDIYTETHLVDVVSALGNVISNILGDYVPKWVESMKSALASFGRVVIEAAMPQINIPDIMPQLTLGAELSQHFQSVYNVPQIGSSGRTRKKPLKVRIRNIIYRYRRKIVEKKVVADSHTLDELVQYAMNTYNLIETNSTERKYIEQQKNLKESLILQHKPEVLGEMKDIPKPDVSNEESVREYFCKIKTRSEMIAEMPDNVIPMNFHLYEIRIGDDSLEMEIDYIWNIFGISYSGNKKVMKQFEKISKDLHIYYGVSEDDIKKKTERYLSLVTALSS